MDKFKTIIDNNHKVLNPLHNYRLLNYNRLKPKSFLNNKSKHSTQTSKPHTRPKPAHKRLKSTYKPHQVAAEISASSPPTPQPPDIPQAVSPTPVPVTNFGFDQLSPVDSGYLISQKPESKEVDRMFKEYMLYTIGRKATECPKNMYYGVRNNSRGNKSKINVVIEQVREDGEQKIFMVQEVKKCRCRAKERTMTVNNSSKIAHSHVRKTSTIHGSKIESIDSSHIISPKVTNIELKKCVQKRKEKKAPSRNYKKITDFQSSLQYGNKPLLSNRKLSTDYQANKASSTIQLDNSGINQSISLDQRPSSCTHYFDEVAGKPKAAKKFK